MKRLFLVQFLTSTLVPGGLVKRSFSESGLQIILILNFPGRRMEMWFSIGKLWTHTPKNLSKFKLSIPKGSWMFTL